MNIDEERKKYAELLKESIEIVLKKLGGKVEKISVFGSYSKRKDLFTDLDILIIMETDKPFLERTKEIYSLLALPVDADILCYTPEEFEKLKSRPFFKEILKGALVLYEKGSN
ncbi:MAG: nucleotidyltransferase domain-containing protein [Thermodesulforhabdaceae bacterium]|jgi:predicted nucleotidyltransferase